MKRNRKYLAPVCETVVVSGLQGVLNTSAISEPVPWGAPFRDGIYNDEDWE